VPELQLVRADHGPAILAFERENRGYFSELISDRGDEYFDRFDEWHNELLREQETGTAASYVLVDDDRSVLGRFNLYRLAGREAEVGYRVAQRVAGRGMATAAVRELCHIAATRYGLRTLKAATSDQNVASQRVLMKAGFVLAEPANPAHIGGKRGSWYRRELACASS
jgi:ribosomal-protein-alanine N-acetyltransferase